jgi:hypothetical protein
MLIFTRFFRLSMFMLAPCLVAAPAFAADFGTCGKQGITYPSPVSGMPVTLKPDGTLYSAIQTSRSGQIAVNGTWAIEGDKVRIKVMNGRTREAQSDTLHQLRMSNGSCELELKPGDWKTF